MEKLRYDDARQMVELRYHRRARVEPVQVGLIWGWCAFVGLYFLNSAKFAVISEPVALGVGVLVGGAAAWRTVFLNREMRKEIADLMRE